MVKKKDVDKAFENVDKGFSIADQWAGEAEAMVGLGHYTNLPPKQRKAIEEGIKASREFNAKKNKSRKKK